MNYKQILAVLAVLTFFLSPFTLARAATIDAAAKLAECDQLAAGNETIEAKLARENCRLQVQVLVLAQCADAQSTEARAAQEAIEALSARVTELEGQAAEPAPTAAVQQTTYAQPMGGRQTFQAQPEVSTVSAHVNTTGKLELISLDNGAGRWAPGASEVRLVVLNHGMPFRPEASGFAFGGTGDPRHYGFEMIYVDLNQDGVTDRMPVWAVDAINHDGSLTVSWSDDTNLTFVWMVKSNTYEYDGKTGMMMPVWKEHPAKLMGRSCFPGRLAPGSRVTRSATNGNSCG